MEFIVCCRSDGSRTVYLPSSVDDPEVVRPDLWIGQGSMFSSRGLAIRIGGAIGDEAGLFVANGRTPYWDPDQEGVGKEILSLLQPKPIGDWDFVMDFLELWLKRVFGQEVTFRLVPAINPAAVG